MLPGTREELMGGSLLVPLIHAPVGEGVELRDPVCGDQRIDALEIVSVAPHWRDGVHGTGPH